MSEHSYTLPEFVDELRRITADHADDKAIITELRPLAQRLATAGTWLDQRYYECDAEQGFGVHLLHEEPDHSLAVSWLPHLGAPSDPGDVVYCCRMVFTALRTRPTASPCHYTSTANTSTTPAALPSARTARSKHHSS